MLKNQGEAIGDKLCEDGYRLDAKAGSWLTQIDTDGTVVHFFRHFELCERGKRGKLRRKQMERVRKKRRIRNRRRRMEMGGV